MKILIVLAIFSATSASAQTCLAKRPPDLYNSRSCWDSAENDPAGREYVYLSAPTVEKVLASEFAPFLDNRTAESISLKAIQNFVAGDGERYAALYLQDKSADDFQPDECNIHSVENDTPGPPAEIFIAPSLLRDLKKSCEDIKLSIAFFVSSVAAVETVRANLRGAGVKWADASDLSWTPVVATANAEGSDWKEALASAEMAGFNAQPMRADAFNSKLVATDIATALEGNQLAYVFDPATAEPIAVVSKLANLSSEEQFKEFAYDDYLFFYPKDGAR